ncbi:ATP-binding protein [bacterium]|nr:ATP-binding protein [bacterium]
MFSEILLAQQRVWSGLLAEPYIERTSADRVLPSGDDRVTVVLGPRRAGKSVYAAHLARQAPGGCGYVNFDDERLLGREGYQPDAVGPRGTDALVAAIDATYGNPRTILFDEIQNVPGWELVVNRLHRSGRRLILTGSNAHLLSSELATHLTGRHRPIPLLPFSFAEFVVARGRDSWTAVENAAMCREHAEVGGFPEVVLKSIDGAGYLRTLLAAVIHKDIVSRFHLRAPQALDAVASCLLSNPGGEFSFASLAHASGCRSGHTLKKYVGYLEQAFLLFTVPRFSFKPREQAASNKKAYAIDNGFVRAAGFQSSPNHGRLLESLVAIACHRRQLRGECRLFYWKDPHRSEVDFVIHEGRSVKTLIQVSGDVRDAKVRSREIRGLIKAGHDLRCEDLVLLVPDERGESRETWQGRSAVIRREPIEEWLLAQR